MSGVYLGTVTPGGRTLGMLAETIEEARHMLSARLPSDAPPEIIPIREHPVCSTCPHLDQCDYTRSGVQWNEHVMGAPYDRVIGYNFVHTCPNCHRHVIDGPGRDSPDVPAGCPRWDEKFGCAVTCERCAR